MSDNTPIEPGLNAVATPASVPMSLTGGTAKGALATVNAPKGMLMNASDSQGILTNMQKLADQINNPYRQFQESLKDMMAHGNYGAEKTQALQAREESRAADRSNLYNIAQQQAALQASQSQAQAQLARLKSVGAPSGTSGSGTPGSGMPPAAQAEYDSLLNAGYLNDAKAIRDKYINTDLTKAIDQRYNPASGVSKMTYIPEIQQELDLTPPEVIAYTNTGKIPDRFGIAMPGKPTTAPTAAPTTAPSTVTPPTGTKVTSGFGVRTDPVTGEPGKMHNGVDLAGAEGTPIPPSKPGTVAYAGNANDGFGNKVIVKHNDGTTSQYAHLKDVSVKPGEVVDLNKVVGTMGSTGKSTGTHLHYSEKDAKGNIVPVSAANVSLPTQKAQLLAAKTSEPDGFVPPYPNAIGSAEMAENRKAREDFRKANLEISKKEGETVAGESGKSRTQMGKLVESSMTTIPAAEKMLEIANDPERSKVFAYLHGGDKVQTALFTAAKHLSKKPPEQLEEEIITNKFGPQALEDYRFIQNAGMKLGIEFAADVFKGARMGIGLEKMAMGAKGIDTSLPANVVKINSQLIRDASKFQVAKQDMFEEWAKTHGGKMASFTAFEGTPEYVKFRDDATKHFTNTYKGIVKPEGNELSPADKAKQELENRQKRNKQ